MNTQTDSEEISTYSDDTGPRIHAFLQSMQPRDGLTDLTEYQRGREAVELLATCSKGEDSPGIILPLSKCANILAFLTKLEPTEDFRVPPGINWWDDPEDAPSQVVGLHIVLRALEESIRRSVVPPDAQTAAEGRGKAYGKALRSIEAIGAAIAVTKRLCWVAPKGSDEEITYKEAVEKLEAALDLVETDFVETAQPVGTG